MTSRTNHAEKLSFFKTLILCLISAIALGISQPIYWPGIFSDVYPCQKYLGALSLIGYAPFFWVVAHKSLKATFWWTVATLSAQFSIILYWIYIAVHVYGYVPPVASALITYALPLILALMLSIFIVLGRFLSLHFNRSFFLFAPLVLCAGEFFRNHNIFGGFPWGNAGYAIGRIDEFLQLASVVGVYGLVFLVGLINALICLWLANFRRRKFNMAGIFAILIILGWYSFGAIRLAQAPEKATTVVKAALLQGNIPQAEKNNAGFHTEKILLIYQDLAKKAFEQGAELIVWPETAYPKYLEEDVKKLPSANVDAASIIGAPAYASDKHGASGRHYHNSAFIADYAQEIVHRYDKSHLVPFGEYVPWPLNGLVNKVVPGIGAWNPGHDFMPVKLSLSPTKKISVGTTICYEGIFPEIARAYARNGAELLVNITNDAWYGRSSAPYQHLLMYRLRSAESGRPFLRATNSGISAFVDMYGTVHDATKLFVEDLVVREVPLLTANTPYLLIGDSVPILCMLGLIILYIISVIPVHTFIKQRQWSKILILISITAIAIAYQIYYSGPQFIGDESAGTKKLYTFLFCLLLLVGSLSKSRRSRSILLACAACTLIIAVILAIFESVHFLWGVVLAALIYILARRVNL